MASWRPLTGELVRLFNPRIQAWHDHFSWDSPLLVGNTREGRATIEVLGINLPERIAHRRLLMETGFFPTHGTEVNSG